MALSKQVNINDRPVAVRELTVTEVRDWLSRLDKTDGDNNLVDELLYDDCSLADLALMTDLGVDDMGALAPSELRVVIDAAKEVNAHFFDLTQRLIVSVRSLAAGSNNAPNPSSSASG